MSARYTDEQRAQLHDGYLAADPPAPSPAAAGLPLEDVERVARAIYTAETGHRRFMAGPDPHDHYRTLAVATLAEMRPTAAEEAVGYVIAERLAGSGQLDIDWDGAVHTDRASAEAELAVANAPFSDDQTETPSTHWRLYALTPVPPDANGGEER